MATTPSKTIDRLRRPEYTGQNRCVPCTVVNLVIAVVVAIALAAAVGLVATLALGAALGVALFSAFAATIYLRGYLVPGTPWFTRTYFPDRVLRWFDKDPGPAPPLVDGEVDVEGLLTRAGAVTECEREDDLCLTDDFQAAWRERILDLRERDTAHEDLATILDVDRDRLTFQEHGDAVTVSLDGQRAGQWESRAAFIADMAAARELEARDRGWSALEVGQQSAVFSALRIFLEQCPACDGLVSLDREVVKSCCRSIDVVAVTCQSCGARVFEAEQP